MDKQKAREVKILAQRKHYDMAQLQPWSVLMFMTPVTIEGSADFPVWVVTCDHVVTWVTWRPRLLKRTMSGSVILLQPGSVLKSMVHVATRAHTEAMRSGPQPAACLESAAGAI